MSLCPKYNLFAQYIQKFRQQVEIDKQKSNPLRYNVWETTTQHIKDMFSKGVDSLPWNENNSQHIKSKVTNALNRIDESPASIQKFVNEVMNDEHNIEYSIALHELMESVKGEADKARNLGIEASKVSNDGFLPALPLSRLAASIGRKIAFQKGYRFKSPEINPNTAVEIENIYYAIGKLALQGLEKKGYVNLHDNVSTIQDYIYESDMKKARPNINQPTNKVLSVSLNSDKLKIKPNTNEAKYFLDRTDSDITDTELGGITDALRAVRQITQPSQYVLPDTKPTKSLEDLAEIDDNNNIQIDPKTAEIRKKLYDTPLYVNNAVHGLMQLLNKESMKTGKSASKLLREKLSGSESVVNSLFGIKLSDNFSIDKKESIAGQNLSKTAPLDDLVEYYDLLQENDAPAPLHLPLKIGRNARLYYENSILNPHGSKQSRYMLTSGQYTVATNSADFDYLVYGIAESLGDKDLSYKDFTEATGSKLDKALEVFDRYEKGTTLAKKLAAVSSISSLFPGVDYVSLITALQAVKDIRNPVGGNVTTEFQVSADATASGGTLTFLQALGTKPEVETFLERIGLIKKKDGSVDVTLNDLYGIMTESINKFIKGEYIEGLQNQELDPLATGKRVLMKDTVNLLFNEGKDTRELSKDPTMTFVYGQGKTGAVDTMSRSLADRILDNLAKPETKEYLVRLLGKEYTNAETQVLKNTRGLYDKVVEELKTSGLVGQLYDIMNATINEEFLVDYKDRSDQAFNLVKKVKSEAPFKILPAAAVMAGIKPTRANIEQYGMPLTKVFEVASKIPNAPDTVLTRKQKLMQTVADVSTIHGIDAVQLYHSLDNVMKDSGVVVVHDDVRGTVQDVRAMEDAYRKMTMDVIGKYDIHQQILEAIRAYDPELAETSDFVSLEQQIADEVDAKRKVIQKRFNNKTDALIGDGEAYKDFAGNQQATEQQPEPQGETKGKQTAKDLLDTLSGESKIITNFLSMANRAKVKLGDDNNFIGKDDVITISGTDIGRGAGEKLDLNDPKQRKKQIELIEHEITHANTVGYIQRAMSEPNSYDYKEIKYFEKAIAQLNDHISRLDPTQLEQLPGELFERMQYINSSSDPAVQVAEFVAIIKTESDTAKGMYSILGKTPGSQLKARIEAFIKRLQKAFATITDQDFEQDIDIEKLYSAVQRTIANGESLREQNYQENKKYMNKFQARLGAGPTGSRSPQHNGTMNYLNHAIATMLSSKIELEGKNAFLNANKLMRKYFPMYSDAADKLAGIYDSSPALQQIVHTVTGSNVNKQKKADILSQFSKVAARQISVTNDQVGKLKKAMDNLSTEQKEIISRFVLDTPLHDYFVLANEFTTADAIAAEVARLEAEIKAVSTKAVSEVNELIEWNVKHNEKSKGKIYNLAAGSVDVDSNFGMKVRKLLALKSINTIGAKEFEAFLQEENLVGLIKDTSVANSLSLIENEGTHKLKDNMLIDYYKEPFQIEAVTESELRKYEVGEAQGWKVLRKPKGQELGIVYRETIDNTSIMGAYTDIKLSTTDIDIKGAKQKSRGLVKTTDGYKLRLTRAEKMKLGLVEDFSQSLVRSAAHNMAIQDSQVIRNAVLQKDSRIVLNKDTKKLEDIIKADNIDNPWFVKLGEDMSYSDLPASVKAKYMPVGNRASDVANFNENVDLVRKDISHWLMGDTKSSYFENPQMKWAVRIVKDLIAGAKIGMVVLNPFKIAQDNVSNVAYLGVMGADPLFIAKQYKNIARDFQEYSDLQRQIVQLKIQSVADPKNQGIKNAIERLREQTKANPVGDIADKGFINSLGSDLVAKNADTLSGLQADMHTALEYMLLNKKGQKNYLGHFITRLHNIGFSGEDFLTYIGNIVKRGGKTGKGVQQTLDQVTERLKEIRTDEDVVNYVSQYTTSPGSEAVRLGASMTDLTDVMAKETFFRYLTEKEGMAPDAARIKVLDSFPDYKENMPLAIKHLSDIGILMFPSFWLRIQKVIYRMVRDKPVNLATELLLEDVVGSNVNTIFDANLINKSNTFGGLLHMPYEPIGVGSVVPTHIW